MFHFTELCFVGFFILSEIEKFQGSDGKKEDEEKKYLDVISNKNIKLSERVLIPVKQYPKVLYSAFCSLSVCLHKNDKRLGLHLPLFDKNLRVCYMNITNTYYQN